MLDVCTLHCSPKDIAFFKQDMSKCMIIKKTLKLIIAITGIKSKVKDLRSI